eukprot:29098-Pelagococcus_subviridis.AAC.2
MTRVDVSLDDRERRRETHARGRESPVRPRGTARAAPTGSRGEIERGKESLRIGVHHADGVVWGPVSLDALAAHDLVVHEQLRVPALLERLPQEVLGDAREVDVIPREVRVHGVVDVRDVVFDVDLLVDRALARSLVVRRAREGFAARGGDRVRGRRLDERLRRARWGRGGREGEGRARGVRK